MFSCVIVFTEDIIQLCGSRFDSGCVFNFASSYNFSDVILQTLQKEMKPCKIFQFYIKKTETSMSKMDVNCQPYMYIKVYLRRHHPSCNRVKIPTALEPTCICRSDGNTPDGMTVSPLKRPDGQSASVGCKLHRYRSLLIGVDRFLYGFKQRVARAPPSKRAKKHKKLNYANISHC